MARPEIGPLRAFWPHGQGSFPSRRLAGKRGRLADAKAAILMECWFLRRFSAERAL
jgi:hypothetical protein